MRRNWLRLGRDDRGAAIIEMALLAPLLATVVIGMTDLSLAYSQKLLLEQAAQRSIEKAMQGMQGDDSTDIFETLQEEAAATAGVNENAVTVSFWLECNGVSQNSSPSSMESDYETVCPSDGDVYSRHVEVRIQKTYTPMFSTRWLGANSDGTYTLVGESGLRVQ
jgi:Flp pilus assembly protein TadG